MFRKLIKPTNLLIFIVVFDLIILFLTEPEFKSFNNGLLKGYEETFLEPLFYMSALFIPSLLLIIFAKRNLFINWLKYIVSWYMPITILFVSQTKVYTSSVMSIDRTLASVYWMFGLFFITVLYVLVSIKGKKIKAVFLNE